MNGTTMKPGARQSSAVLRRAAFALGLGALGGLINLYELQLGTGVTFVLGNFAYIIVAARLRAHWALASALLAVTPLLWHWGHPWAFLTFGLEAVVVSLLRGRRMRAIYADMLYWVVLGMPLTALLVAGLQPDLPLEHMLAICVKQAFNGIAYTAFAALLVLLGEQRFEFDWSQQPPCDPTLRGRLVHALVVITAFTLMTSGLLITRELLAYQESLLRRGLEESATQVARRAADYVESHARGVAALANLLTHGAAGAEVLQPLLAQQHLTYSGFVTMLAADTAGRIVAASPAERMHDLATDYVVSDRDYFIEAMRGDAVFVSGVFRGRGFGSDPIVAISQSWRDLASGERRGVIEGSLNLGGLTAITAGSVHGNAVDLVLVDPGGLVIFATERLGFAALTPFAGYRQTARNTGRDSLLLEVNGSSAEFLHHAAALDNGWQVHVLLDYHALIHALNLQYLGIFLALALATGLAGALAGLSARRLVQPLERLARELAGSEHGAVAQLVALPTGAAQEIVLVHEELQRSIRMAARHREELEQQVDARTRELEQANALLQALASADALTGLGNRRVLEERFPMLRAVAQRAGGNIAVAVLDLDHFKQLNDRHGHLVGDECLRRVAALMQQEFARRTDVSVRFGGEEFVIAVECPSLEVLQRKLDALREQIGALQLAGEDGTAIRVTASFGAVLGPAGQAAELNDWLRLADACLYRAKDAGRNTVIAEVLAA